MTSPITSLQHIIDGLANEIPLKRALRDQILIEELLHLPVQFANAARILEAVRASQLRAEQHNYEARALYRLLAQAPYLDIQQPEMVFARHGFAHKPFMESMAFAMTQALITPAQHADLFEAGMIITGHIPGPTRHAVAEFAARPDPAAVSALRRAAVLQKAIGQQTIAVVATPDPEQLQTGDLPNLHIVQLLL